MNPATEFRLRIIHRIDTARTPMFASFRMAAAVVAVCSIVAGAHAEDHPLPEKQRQELATSLDEQIAQFTKRLEADPKKVGFYSRRGDAYFFRGRFKESVADYQKMVELDPKLEKSHWRRGIAWFYAGDFKQAAHQFEIYDTFDNIDRENGIWRFFSQAKAYGVKRARKGLLKYKKDDREPFPSVYKLFGETMTPAEILAAIAEANIDKDEREKRLFFAQLYIGLNYDIHGDSKKAEIHLREAVANKWGPTAGGGPSYMWHVGRLHYNRLREKNNKP
jgi:lipoprotein NlpI